MGFNCSSSEPFSDTQTKHDQASSAAPDHSAYSADKSDVSCHRSHAHDVCKDGAKQAKRKAN